jgi:hypothetical protein
MDLLDDEIISLWRSLDANKVKYILVGGFATNLHGYNRVTADIDIWIKDEPKNRKNLRRSLNELELGDFGSLETTQLIPGFTSILLSSGFELDIMTELKGLEQLKFDECYSKASTAIIEGITIKFLHINHLIESKKATGRPKDLIDAEELEKIRNKEL